MGSFQDELSDLFQEANATFVDASGKPLTITACHVTKPCIASAPIESREMQNAGWTPELARTVLVLRPDFQALRIRDQSLVSVGGIPGRVIAIEDDPADPMVTLRLAADS